MSDVIPRHVLCVLGSGSGFGLAEMERIAGAFGGFVLDREYSQDEPDPRMPEAFEASMAGVPFGEADRDAVASHDTVGYLLADPRAQEIEDGAGFRLTEDAPRHVLRTGDCDRYDEDDLFFNPYGYIRLTRPQ